MAHQIIERDHAHERLPELLADRAGTRTSPKRWAVACILATRREE